MLGRVFWDFVRCVGMEDRDGLLVFLACCVGDSRLGIPTWNDCAVDFGFVVGFLWGYREFVL